MGWIIKLRRFFFSRFLSFFPSSESLSPRVFERLSERSLRCPDLEPPVSSSQGFGFLSFFSSPSSPESDPFACLESFDLFSFLSAPSSPDSVPLTVLVSLDRLSFLSTPSSPESAPPLVFLSRRSQAVSGRCASIGGRSGFSSSFFLDLFFFSFFSFFSGCFFWASVSSKESLRCIDRDFSNILACSSRGSAESWRTTPSDKSLVGVGCCACVDEAT